MSSRLSASPLWRWSAQYYARAGTDAWASGTVPWRLTNSVRVAEAYARLVSAWRTDLIAAGLKAPHAPVEVLELGGGAGRLAFHLTRWLEEAAVPYQLLWSDAAESNVEAFRRRQFVQERAGQIEALTLDALGGSSAPPLAPDVVIGTYLFDSLPHDAWSVRDGQVFEQQVRVELPLGDGPECERAVLHWSDAPVDPPAFVRGYAARIGQGGFTIPVGALACLKRVGDWSHHRCLVLAADKGTPTLSSARLTEPPRLQRHGGISAMVNFDALKAFWGWRPHFQSAHAEEDLGFYAFAQGLRSMPVTFATWSATLGAESLLHRKRELDELLAGPASAAGLFSALQRWGDDPDVFVRMAEPLRSMKLSGPECEQWVGAIDRCWARHFELGGNVDVAFEMASVLHRHGQLSHAARFYRRSLADHGRHATVCFNLALCHLDLGDLAQGRQLLTEVLQLAPEHPGATRILAQL